MSDIGIFMFGCCVFGIAIAATIASIIGPSQKSSSTEEQNELATKGRELQEKNRESSKKLAS